ncbi:hypothetical protein [Flavobacterium sp.]|jgi:hypothetical protein|uniref:hypothetical protein n=1 Tax=Flavobacterium sp. TaxID=239 RepID=UPI00391D3AE7
MKEKKSKFSLDKFEVAKLKNSKTIHGGDGTDNPDTITNTMNLGNSGIRCKDLTAPPPPPPRTTV